MASRGTFNAGDQRVQVDLRRRDWESALPHKPREDDMTIHLDLAPLLALIAGIVILVKPKLLNYVVAGYLILIGVIGLFNLQV